MKAKENSEKNQQLEIKTKNENLFGVFIFLF